MKKRIQAALLGAAAFLPPPAEAAEIRAVASVRPVHALAAAVMLGAPRPPELLIKNPAASPHAAALKPSQAAMLENAGVVFWIGPGLEAFLKKPLKTAGAGAVSVELTQAEGVRLLERRSGGNFARRHSHGHDEHDGHDEHGHDEQNGHDDREHDDHGHDDHGHDDHDDRSGGADPHIWLDPVNAKAMAHAMARALAGADPVNGALYQANAAALGGKLDALTAEIAALTAPVRGRWFIAFHDAYRYFEERFGVRAAGVVKVSHETAPGARHIAELRTDIKRMGAVCVFSEPQFDPKLVRALTERSAAKFGVLDPLGAGLTPGPELYFSLLRRMAASMRACMED